MITGKAASLQLSDPIPALGQRQDRIACQMALELCLIEALLVEGPELRGKAKQRSDEPELRGDDVDNDAEPRLLGKLEAILGFPLHLNERIARREQVCVQVVAAISRKGEVTDFVRGIEGA